MNASVPLWVVLLAISVLVLVVAFAIGWAVGREHPAGNFTPSVDTRPALGCVCVAVAFVVLLAAWAAMGWWF